MMKCILKTVIYTTMAAGIISCVKNRHDYAVHLYLQGYPDDSVTVVYLDGTKVALKVSNYAAAAPWREQLIKNLQSKSIGEIFIGRKDLHDISLNFSGDELVLRAPINDRIPVGTCAEMRLIWTSPDSRYIQEANIFLMGIAIEPCGTEDIPFSGSFDGAGFILNGITINQPERDNTGLFGYVAQQAYISSVIIEGNTVSGANCVGALCGYNNGVITDCSASVNISGKAYTGGVAGYNKGRIERCQNRGTVSATFYAGGVTGTNDAGNITGCSNAGRIDGQYYLGGICGQNQNGGIVHTCTNSGELATHENEGRFMGGVCGENTGAYIDSCNNSGNINGIETVGGICGKSQAEITYCHNSGNIVGQNIISGICGINSSKIAFSCNDGTISGNNYTSGICSQNNAGTIVSCYNSAVIQGNLTGGICAFMRDMENATAHVTACYNIGLIESGSSQTGGICGNNQSGTISACYSSGPFNSNTSGGICGINSGVIIASYYSNAAQGIISSRNEAADVRQFSAETWPTDDNTKNWGIGNDESSGKYWKTLGKYSSDGKHTLPQLAWEK
ncbi:MAG: hypothetical protein LBR06_04440 [Bacteroidales bacterium]|jgi:hypothetical protein|nr:hypothetical protein [Bacteroidales bacterium]